MGEHTPGPWSINSSGAEIVEGRGIVIAEVFDRGSETPRPQANARLIAAAPDMLAALQAIVHPDVEALVYFVPDDAWAQKLRRDVQAAIAKATASDEPKN